MTNLRFKLTFSNDRVWALSMQRPTRVLDSMNICLSLNIVCSNLRVISFCINERNLESNEVFRFLFATFSNMLNSREIRSPYLLVLDNGPKNRTKAIRRLSTNNLIRYIYTTPTTPQHNLAECFFLELKKHVKKQHISGRYIIRY